MSNRISPAFFEAKAVLLIGYSKRQASYCGSIRKGFESRGSAVYPVNPMAGGYDVKVYASIAEAPEGAELAVVFTNKSRNEPILGELASKGVKRVLFVSGLSGDAALLARCATLGMEGAVACPLMVLGKGFHRFHGWLAGLPRLAPR